MTVESTAARKTTRRSSGAKRTTSAAGAKKAPAAQGAEPELVQLLTPEGERVQHPDYDIDLSAEELRGLYRDMVLTRRFDAEATSLQRQGELGLWASLLGQEAAQIGSGRALRDDDYVFPTYREHGVAWVRGVDPTNLLGMFRGVNHGGWDPNSNNFHLYTIVIGSQTLHATGYAMGIAKDGADSAVIAYFGDGASSQGDVNEAFTFSAVYNAPVVFFCQNNQWAISEPTEKQTRVPLYQRARGFGFPGVRVDGNDVLACLAVTRSALERARRGEGPTLVEAFTYRMGAHTTSDDPTKYRRDEEREAWEAKDPILRLKAYLEREGHADEAFFEALEAESEALGKRVREGVRTMPDPDDMAIFENVYADGHALVDEERAQFAAYQASFADGEVK
ncbi:MULTISPECIES: pyruvate dehydrogenase (acetyl-transferring) E1 component subunit alpha [Streptomyces]|uniref:Pyruvate dehydrogenase E1 component alpha subunit n=1 Tax=Streptomyces venezuelae (strain ATCC 10712 / CBS 650.69 / DSM 40230 / JCM 4526 / NBRC 13096 / PD 04745) TaxID=953739 RepID=F2RCX7_STRVP|nr:pyruvate dehydrogenase (acetyl-transferring) E1 component subunit alpha [Streptomyces venezuelae]APE22656.1 pyruvate dehydrogenase (acetyl-transferring) E1 component subunit alpha [Streptomyces venezuelae]QES00034.1 pyruvate dehydrogenase (acetyl-transferring) E1 component subunit alpha [Streptomyces venezuelae ATCC 10712]QES07084.1 pyruvate dehydrogenase (acetyl-transferring) E1 component subunit alpha [Streptomyces venezuelae]CCA56873.1 Pyruvate dehydrogenase E1 component alpha subunit [St